MIENEINGFLKSVEQQPESTIPDLKQKRDLQELLVPVPYRVLLLLS